MKFSKVLKSNFVMNFIWGLGDAPMKDLRLFLGQGGVMKSPPYVVTCALKQTYLMKTRLEWVEENERKIYP